MAKLKSKKLSKTAIRNASIAAASAAVAGVLTGCSLYGNDTYTVKFNTVGGSSVESQKIVWGEKINNPASPTKEGYTFDGWYLDANYKTKVDEVNYVVEGDVEFFAKWKINSYTITFATNGGEEIDPITKNYNSTISIDDPEREGYIFDGWYLDAALTKPFDMVIPSSDTTVYAKWIACELTITFDKNSEEAVGEMEIQTIKTNATLNQLSSNTFKREGYTFKGWAITPEGEVAYQENETISLVNQNKEITLYAVWEANDYTVSFIANNEEFATFTGDYRSQFTLPTNTPTRNGYTFVNWGTYKLTEDEKFKGEKQYFSNVGTEKDPIYELISVVDGADVAAGLYYEIVEYTNRDIPLNGLKLYAIFTKNTYTITFNTNGGSVVSNISKLYGEEITKPASPTKEGYTFKGWFTSQGQTNDDWGNEYIVFSTMPSNSFTLYAKWEVNNYALSFNSNGGSEISPLNKAFGSEITLPSPTRTGYTFKGWATSLEGEVIYSPNSKYTITSAPQVLHAVWEANTNTKYIVNHYGANLAGGGYSPILSENLEGTTDERTSVEYVSTLDKTSPFYGFEGVNAITQEKIKPDGTTIINLFYQRKTYSVSFVDEEKNPLCSPVKVIYQGSVEIIPSELVRTGYDYLLSNNFTAETTIEEDVVVVVTYDARETTSIAFYNYPTNENPNIQTIVRDYGTDISSLAVTPIRTGYTFKGWFTLNGESSGDWGEKYSFTTMPAESIDLYAKWEPKQYTLYFEENGGSSVTDITLDYQANITRPSDPTKDGHTFAGWYLDPQFKFVYSFGQMPAENITVYAKWNVNSYMFTLVNDGIVTSNQVLAYGSTLNLPTLEKYGYDFKGWATVEDGEVEYEGNSLYSITSENVTLYAIWDVKQVTYTFSVDGIVKNTVTNDYDSDFSVQNPPSYNDENNTYYFAGWKEKDAGENAVLYDFSNGSKLGMENKEYVAVFNSVPYTIKYQNKNGGTTLWETSSSAEDSSFKQYISYLYQRQNAFDYISKAIKNAVEGTDALPITVTATYFNLLLNPSLTEGIEEIGVPFNVLPFENQAAVIAKQTSTTTEYALNVINILSVFDLNNNNDFTYITYVSKFNPNDMAAMEVASTATSEYLTLVSAELTKYEDNAYNPYRNDGYIFNGWKTTIDADNENPTKYVYASWVKQIEAPENLHVSTIAKTYVEFSWNKVENAYGYYVNYSINGEVKPTIATQENKVPINVSANDTIEISVITINADENGNRFETSNAYETPSLKDENITLTQESVSLNSEPCSPISYTHVITGEQEITASGDFFYKTEYGELYLFSNSSYTFKNVVAMEIISGNSFARITDQNGTPTLTTGSNAGTITFRTYKVASGTAKENETYYSYVDGSYSLVSVEVGSSVEGYYLGEEHIAKISLLVSNIGLGTELYSYTSAETSGDYLNTTEFDAYLIGAALTDSSLYTEYASGNYSNGFKFDFDINTTSGNILDFSTFPLEYTFYELDGNEWKEVSDPSSLYIYDEEQDVFYFLKSSGQYKVSISFKKDGYYETKDSSLDPNKKYYYLENGEYKLFDRENPVDATTYYEHFVNVSLPNAFKERNISKEFEFTLNDGINVFNDYGLKQAFSNKDVSSINLHSTIKSEFNSHSISYIPYLEDTGLSTKMSHSYMKYGELDIVSGTAEMTDNPSYGPLCWKQSTSTTSELDAAGTFYFLDKSGVVYVYDYTNGTHAIKDCEWKEVYGNTETKVGKFKILNDAFGNDPTYNNYGLSVGSIYTRSNKESVDLKVNGNYFTIDASDLPYVMSTYGNVAGNGIVASYKIQNVKVSIFDIISGTGTSFENMSVIGNTENASETLSGSSGESLTISEQMEKTSGGILAFKNMYIGSDINLDNINISKATIGVHTTYLANATINYTHVWDIWANSIYASGGDTTSVSNSVIDPSGGASFHIEDNFYTIDDKGSSVYTYKDVVIPNSGVLTNPTFDLGYISTHANNLVSGEEQWFKAYSMEIVAMGMKSTLENKVQTLNTSTGSNYTILQTVTDPVTNLTSEKMNFVFLGKTHNIKQGNSEIKLADVKVDFTFGGPIIQTQQSSSQIIYTIAKEEVENPEDVEIIYNVVYVPLVAPTQEGESVSALYIIKSPDGTETIKAYFFFKEKLSETEIIYGMVELYEKQ